MMPDLTGAGMGEHGTYGQRLRRTRPGACPGSSERRRRHRSRGPRARGVRTAAGRPRGQVAAWCGRGPAMPASPCSRRPEGDDRDHGSPAGNRDRPGWLADISEDWPRHLHNGMRARAEGLVDAGGRRAGVDAGRVARIENGFGETSCRARVSPPPGNAGFLVGAVLAALPVEGADSGAMSMNSSNLRQRTVRREPGGAPDPPRGRQSVLRPSGAPGRAPARPTRTAVRSRRCGTAPSGAAARAGAGRGRSMTIRPRSD